MAARIGQQPYLNPAQHEGFCSKVKTLAVIVVQLATRVLFIVASIWMAAAALPLQFHAILLPAVAFGSTVLAGFFFPKPVHVTAEPAAELPPLLRPIAPRAVVPAVPPNLVQEAPRPLLNIGNNCWINSLVHFFNSDPLISQWFRNPLRDDVDMAAFEQFLAGYTPSDANFVADPINPILRPSEAFAQVLAKFREYVNNPANPRASIPNMFKTFLRDHLPDQNYARQFRAIKDTFNDLRLLQGPFANFFADYDQAMVENRPVGRSQELRMALNLVNARIEPSEYVQMDAAEPLNLIVDRLPNRLKARVKETYTYDTRGLPPIRDNAAGISTQELFMGTIEMAIPLNKAAPSLEDLINYHADESMIMERKDVNLVDRDYPANIRRQFVEAPPVLRFQIKRFDWERAPYSVLNHPWLAWFTGLFPKLSDRPVKRDTPVSVPENLTITLANGERKQYRLTGFVNHHGGSANSGHYTAAQVINGRKYLMSDQEVTLADPARWEERLRHAYLLCYVPVQA